MLPKEVQKPCFFFCQFFEMLHVHQWLKGSDVNGQYTQQSNKAILNILDKEAKIVIGHKFLEQRKLSEINQTDRRYIGKYHYADPTKSDTKD